MRAEMRGDRLDAGDCLPPQQLRWAYVRSVANTYAVHGPERTPSGVVVPATAQAAADATQAAANALAPPGVARVREPQAHVDVSLHGAPLNQTQPPPFVVLGQ